MKKKVFQIMFVILLAFVSGCNKEPEKTEYDNYDYNYEATVSNISAFYDLSKTFKPTSNGFELNVKLEPRVLLLAKGLTIQFQYVVEYLKTGEKDYIDNTYDFTVTSSDFYEITYSNTNTSLSMSTSVKDVNLVSLKITGIRGSIYTFEEVDTINTPEKINKDNYDKLVLDMKVLDKFSERNYLAVETISEFKFVKGTTVTSQNSNVSVKLRKSPFYMETSILDEKNIILEEDGSLLSFDVSSNQKNGLYWVDRLNLGPISNEGLYYDEEEIIGAGDLDTNEIDYNKIKIDIKDNVYVLSGVYKDFLPKEEFQQLQALYKTFGLSETILNNATFKITITLNDYGFIMETHAIIPVNTDAYDKIESITTISISNDGFATIDLYDKDQYYITLPKSFDEVYEATNVLEDVVSLESKSTQHYYLTHLDGGQYYFNNYKSYLTLTIYDLELNKIDLGEYFGRIGNHPLKNYFKIPKGDYYVRIGDNGGIGYKFKIEKIDYKDFVDLNKPIVIKEGTFDFEIEGSNDLLYVNYYSDNAGVLKVTNNTNKFSRVYYDEGGTTSPVNEILDDGKFYAITKGNNYFYFMGNVETYSYNIEFIEVDNNKDKIDLVDLNEFNDFIITGPKLGESYFKLDVKEKGIYSFKYETLNINPSGPQMGIYDLNTDNLVAYSMGNQNVTLDFGSYYIRASATKTSIFKLTYTFEKIK